MFDVIRVLLRSLAAIFKSCEQLLFENPALRHQVHILKRNKPRPNLGTPDRLLWISLKTVWPNWKTALIAIRPKRVLGWHRSAFRAFWRLRSQPRDGRFPIDPGLIRLIRRMWQVNPLWGCIRIRDELARLGLRVSDSTIRKYRPKSWPRPSQTWRSFLNNHLSEIAAMDFFVVPTATFRVLYVFIVLAH